MSFALLVHAIAQSTGASTGATTAARDTTGANLIVLATSSNDTGGGLAVSDTAGNTWTALTFTPSGTPEVRLWYCVNPTTNAAHTFSVTGSGEYSAIQMSAYSGSANSPFDQENEAYQGSATTTLQPGSVTPSQGSELVITAYGVNNPGWGGSVAVSAPFTVIDSANFVPAQSYGLAVAHEIQTTATARNPTWTAASATIAAAAIATFKASVVVPSLDHIVVQVKVGGTVVTTVKDTDAPVASAVGYDNTNTPLSVQPTFTYASSEPTATINASTGVITPIVQVSGQTDITASAGGKTSPAVTLTVTQRYDFTVVTS